MNQTEDQADSEALDISDKMLFQKHYTDLVAQHYRLRKAVETDFRRTLLHLKDARGASRSETIHIINELISYLTEVIPELKKLRLNLAEQMGEVAEYIDGLEGTLDEMFEASPRFF